LRRRTGQAPVEVDRLTAQVAAIARRTVAQGERVTRNARRALRRRPGDGRLRRLVARLEETATLTHRLLAQTASDCAATARSATGCSRWPRGSVVRWVRPSQGAVLQLVQHRQPVGRLIVTFRQGQWTPPVIRLALATVAHALATTGPAVSHDQ
jgi:hypothetical protein